MALYGFSKDTVARIWRAVLYVERQFLRAASRPNERTRRLPRTYRRFTLTAQLDAGSSAAVEWDDGTTGTVHTPNVNAYGLAGETGEAYPVVVDDAIEWRVSQNPGQPVYRVTADSDITSTGAAAFTTTIAGESVSVTATVPAGSIPDDTQIASGSVGFIAHSRGAWHLISLAPCREDV